MKYRKSIVVLCISICLFCVACTDFCAVPSWKGGPENGLWYCEELKMQLYCKELDHSDVEALNNGSFDSQSYVIVDDETIMCMLSNSAGVGEYVVHVSGLYADSEQTFLNAELVSINESTWVVEGDTDKQYTFKRIDSFSLEQIQNDNAELITAYAGTADVGEIHHIETAKEMASSLFETELGIAGIWEERDLSVSFSNADRCWLIVGTPSASPDGKTPHALIQKDGQVIAVWLK